MATKAKGEEDFLKEVVKSCYSITKMIQKERKEIDMISAHVDFLEDKVRDRLAALARKVTLPVPEDAK